MEHLEGLKYDLGMQQHEKYLIVFMKSLTGRKVIILKI